MLKPDTRTLEAISSLEGNASFEQVMTWLRGCRDLELQVCGHSLADTPMRQAQGAYQCLSEVVATIEQARETMKRRQQRPQTFRKPIRTDIGY